MTGGQNDGGVVAACIGNVLTVKVESALRSDIGLWRRRVDASSRLSYEGVAG